MAQRLPVDAHESDLALEHDAYVRWDGQSLKHVHGTALILEPGNNGTRLA